METSNLGVQKLERDLWLINILKIFEITAE